MGDVFRTFSGCENYVKVLSNKISTSKNMIIPKTHPDIKIKFKIIAAIPQSTLKLKNVNKDDYFSFIQTRCDIKIPLREEIFHKNIHKSYLLKMLTFITRIRAIAFKVIIASFMFISFSSFGL